MTLLDERRTGREQESTYWRFEWLACLAIAVAIIALLVLAVVAAVGTVPT